MPCGIGVFFYNLFPSKDFFSNVIVYLRAGRSFFLIMEYAFFLARVSTSKQDFPPCSDNMALNSTFAMPIGKTVFLEDIL